MRTFYPLNYAIAFFSILGGFLVPNPVYGQTALAQQETPKKIPEESTKPTDTVDSSDTGDVESSEPSESHASRTFIQGYGCYSSPTEDRTPTTYAIIGNDGGQPQYIPIIRWTSTAFQNSGYSPQVRCQAVSTRLDNFLKQGILEYIIEGTLSGQDVLFAASQLIASSGESFALEPARPNPDNLIITLEPQDDPAIFLSSFVGVLRAQQSPISRGSRWVRVPGEVDSSEITTEIPVDIQDFEVDTERNEDGEGTN